MREDQRRVAAFLDEADVHAPPAYRLLDLAAEIGEIAADAAKSSGYGADPDALSVSRDEVGDVLFASLALAEELDMDAEAALEASLAKYEERLDANETVGSGE